MKNISYYILIIVSSWFISCNDILEKYPLDMITDGVVWDDATLIDAYMMGVYTRMYILTGETAVNWNQDWWSSEYLYGPYIIHEMPDECTYNWLGQSSAGWKSGSLRIGGGILEWWENGYLVIRALNVAIENLQTSTLDDALRNPRLAEARFLRAYNYFSMVKRYGGVPLVTKEQQTNDPEEELYPPRASEQAIYDFVISEMDAIADDLFTYGAETFGRPTKYAAMALKCRAALYAGSIAQFGKVQLNGLLGIDANKAPEYYQKACDAAQVIMNSGVHRLYNADADKVVNFKNIFLVKNNPEAIWVKKHNYLAMETGGNGWNWDAMQSPRPSYAGNKNAPYLEMAESFEYIDGRSGKLDRMALEQGLWDTEDIWKGKDPRFFATLWTHNTPWKGILIDFHNGLILPDGTLQTSGSYEGVLAGGTQNVDGNYGTGFGVMKYLEESKDNLDGAIRCTSGTDWQLFRYGEVLLNYAEAAFELGRTGEALDAINQIRDRAGISLLTAIDREAIYHERKVELAFEAHRYWDLRRWRKAVNDLTGGRSGLRFILDYETRKVQIRVLDADGASSSASNWPRFYEEHYYLPITLARTANNPNLVENPGY